MAQQTHYDMRFIIATQSGQNMQCDVDQQSQVQVNEFCIGYLRAVVPKISSATVQELAYTGHPCHRSYVILIPTNQPGSVDVSDDNPVVEVIACFKKDDKNQQLKRMEAPKRFTVPPRQMVMWSGPNVKKQECDPQQLVDNIQGKLGLTNFKFDEVKNYLPRTLYYVQ
jgi:hypothetical protein